MYITLHYITLHYITLHHNTVNYITLLTLHFITLHYVTLHYSALHCIAFHYQKRPTRSPGRRPRSNSGIESVMAAGGQQTTFEIRTLSCDGRC